MRRGVLPALVLHCMLPVLAAANTDDTLRVRIADVGTVTRAPGGAVLVYDAGHWQGRRCIETARALVPGDTLELLVLSHSDSDRLGDAAEIQGEYTVRQILWTGFRRPEVATWGRANAAIAEEVRTEGASVRSLTTQPLTPGETVPLGDATITLLAGWGRWDSGTGLSEA